MNTFGSFWSQPHRIPMPPSLRPQGAPPPFMPARRPPWTPPRPAVQPHWHPNPNWQRSAQQLAPIVVAPPPVAMTTPTPTVVVPPSMPEPQPSIQPASPVADLGPTQDANAEAAAPTVVEHPGHAWGRKIIIGLVVAGAAFGGYKLYQRSKKPSGGHGHGHGHKHGGLEGFRRRRRR